MPGFRLHRNNASWIDCSNAERLRRLAGLAAELVNLKVDVLVCSGTKAGLAAKRATATIPIVVSNMGDALNNGFVASCARPGGNVAGVSLLNPENIGAAASGPVERKVGREQWQLRKPNRLRLAGHHGDDAYQQTALLAVKVGRGPTAIGLSPRTEDLVQFGPSIDLLTARYSSRTWLVVRYFGRMFSSGVTGTRAHVYCTEPGHATLSDGASGASLVSRFGRSLKR